MALEWKKRRSKSETPVARLLTRESRCGRYRVVERRWLLKAMDGKRDWIAMDRITNFTPEGYIIGVCWRILSEHKKEATAAAACEKHAKKR